MAYGKRREPFAKVDQEVTFQGDCQIKINYSVNKCYFCVKSANPCRKVSWGCQGGGRRSKETRLKVFGMASPDAYLSHRVFRTEQFLR